MTAPAPNFAAFAAIGLKSDQLRFVPGAQKLNFACAGMMLDDTAIGRAIEMIDSSAFYRSAHGKLFDAIVALYNSSTPADMITVSEELKRRGDYEAVGGAAGLAQILDHATTSANLKRQSSQRFGCASRSITTATWMAGRAATEGT